MSETTRASQGVPDAYLLVARIVLGLMFLLSGWAKFGNVAGTAGYLGSLGAPMPGVLVWVAIGFELVLPVLFILGLFTRWAALGLVLYTAMTIIIGHRFWEYPAAQQFSQQMSMFKNIAIMLLLGFIAQVGPGRYALKP